ncbi:nuclear transcription factor Y subunit B-1-like [Impatiens glandulifera]|uniref:nuclear transcription factor Y subunit B-1-like n=1 Tax=Impatiens glandulifera TaxID=253017 RepID=UPI001FB04DA1|nr:nuclear transcription factor Y subunit B-1-like [Impatiens glandulifera]
MNNNQSNLTSLPSSASSSSEIMEAECTVREQDRFMPIANVIRIMRRILPPHAKISDDAKETIQECVSEFISFITGEANERCQREQRKTITAEDVLWAMSKLGFDDYIEPLTLFLNRHRDCEGERSSSVRGGDPFLFKRVDPNALAAAAFGPVFHLAAHHHHPHPHPGTSSFFGAAVGHTYLKDSSGPATGPSQTGLDPYNNAHAANNK